MKKFRKKGIIILIVCILVLELVCGATALVIYTNYKNPKKAVIILPGLFASGLYDTATGNDVWDPFGDLDLWFTDFTGRDGLPYGLLLQLLTNDSVSDQLQKLLANDGEGSADSLFNLMAMNEDGTPVVDTIQPVPFDSESRLKYGVVNAQTELYESLEEQYGAAYEVLVFNYDFRLDNRDSAAKLATFINEEGYDEVILVSHSNGGEVAACYLGASEANRDKVSLYLSYDSPYYGSFSAISTLENIDSMISGVIELLQGNILLQSLGDTVSDIFNNQFKKLINMWAVYQLLPSYELLTTQQYLHTFTEQIIGINGTPSETKTITVQEAMINIDGEDVYFESSEDLWEFYCSRPWAKMSNGELRPAMAQWLEYHEAMMVELPDGKKVHSTTLVNTHYFSGMGYDNTTKVYYETVDGELTLTSERDYSDQGDGTVMLYSATAGTTAAERIHIIPYADHYDVVQRYNIYSSALTTSIIERELTFTDKLLIKIYS